MRTPSERGMLSSDMNFVSGAVRKLGLEVDTKPLRTENQVPDQNSWKVFLLFDRLAESGRVRNPSGRNGEEFLVD